MYHGANSCSVVCEIRKMVKTPLLIRRGFIYFKKNFEHKGEL